MAKHGKSYNAAAEKIDRATLYTPLQAAKLIKELDTAKFDETVEAHFRLGIDTRKADQNIRGSISLPHGTGKTVRVAVFAEGEKAREAEAAGADIIGDEEFLSQLDKEELNFDILVATPQYMPKLGKYARLLGPRGLMPNPKSGTVATDVAKAVSEAKAGKVEYRVDKTNICHCPVGKVSFGKEKIGENLNTLMDAIIKAKPAAAKGTYIKSLVLSTTMGPGVKFNGMKF